MKKQRINQIYQIRFVENNLLKSICFNSTFILPLFKKIKWNTAENTVHQNLKKQEPQYSC